MKIFACSKICKVFSLKYAKFFEKIFCTMQFFFMIFEIIYAKTKLLFSYANAKIPKFFCKKLVKLLLKYFLNC